MRYCRSRGIIRRNKRKRRLRITHRIKAKQNNKTKKTNRNDKNGKNRRRNRIFPDKYVIQRTRGDQGRETGPLRESFKSFK